MNETKSKIKNLTDIATLSDSVKTVINNFLDKYEGEYTDEVVALIFALILADTKILKDSAAVEGFEKIIGDNKEPKEIIDSID